MGRVHDEPVRSGSSSSSSCLDIVVFCFCFFNDVFLSEWRSVAVVYTPDRFMCSLVEWTSSQHALYDWIRLELWTDSRFFHQSLEMINGVKLWKETPVDVFPPTDELIMWPNGDIMTIGSHYDHWVIMWPNGDCLVTLTKKADLNLLLHNYVCSKVWRTSYCGYV